MRVTKNNTHYLLQNSKGEYHLSIEDFEKLGKDKAIELATKEIDKKHNSAYRDIDIDFSRARELGFCEYGIKEFANMLELNVDETYTMTFLKDRLTTEAFIKYPTECIKLFGNSVFDKFGGIKAFLNENRTEKALNVVLNSGLIEDKKLHKLATVFALNVLPNFEKEFPDDNRPRQAIEAKIKWLNGELTDDELAEAESAASSATLSAARSATRSAAWSATRSAARSATRSAARSAASSAAWSAESAAWSTARSAEINFQINEVLKVLEE